MDIQQECIDLLNEYGHAAKPRGMSAVLKEWKFKDEYFSGLFKNSPFYVPEEHALVFPHDFHRDIDASVISSAIEQFQAWAKRLVKPYLVKGYWTIEQVRSFISHLDDDICIARSGWTSPSRMTVPEMQIEMMKWRKYLDQAKGHEYCCGIHTDDGLITDFGTEESIVPYRKLRKTLACFAEYASQELDADIVDRLNELCPELKAVVGQRTSKVLRRLLTKVYDFPSLVPDKVDRINPNTGEVTGKMLSFEQVYAGYSDAINPLTIKRFTVVSWLPQDYYTMSFGPNWTTCMSIDKENRRKFDRAGAGHAATYHGMYCLGTESYLQDGTTLVFYTVSADYDWPNQPMWKADKITRQLFHFYKGMLIQGRNYPGDQRDAHSENVMSRKQYEPYRKIVQKLIADAMGLPNLWTAPVYTEDSSLRTDSCGHHYHDYDRYDNCNQTILRGSEADCGCPPYVPIGSWEICPSCGGESDDSEWLLCEDCREHRCASCGRSGDPDSMWNIDDEWYCDDCCTKCASCCDRVTEWDHVEYYGDVCDACLHSRDDIVRCNHCEEWMWTESCDVVCIEDEWYCSDYCAEREGYTYNDETEEWIREEEE